MEQVVSLTHNFHFNNKQTNRIMRHILFSFMLLFVLGTAQAQTVYVTNDGYFAAISESDFDLAISLSVDRDYKALQKLIDSGRVIQLRAGIEVYLVDSSWGTVKVRLKGDTITFYTNSEAISRK